MPCQTRSRLWAAAGNLPPEAGLVLRLDEADRTAFREKTGATEFEPMPGRKMREYSVVSAALLQAPDKLKPWALKSFAYVGSLPAKAPKPRATHSKASPKATGKSGKNATGRPATRARPSRT